MGSEAIRQIEEIFHPRSIAVVGASNRVGKFSRFFMENLVEAGFPNLYPINPNEKNIIGFAAFPNVAQVPGEVDLAILVTPPEVVVQAVADCAEKGVKGIIIYTSGFGEQSEKGRQLEREMVDIARSRGTRIIGPNCMGVYCPASRLTPFQGLPKERGKVGMISHSGSLINLIGRAAGAKGICFSKMASCGNECDLTATDFLEYLGQDSETKVIIAYLEGVKDGRRFFQLARTISPSKPIIVWKGGTTQRGSKAAASHTGALAGSASAWRIMFRQTGIIEVKSAEELIDCLLAFYHLSLPQGNRVVVMSGPGGPAVATSDACVELGLEMAEISYKAKERVAEFLLPVGTVIGNPMDLGMGSVFVPEFYRDTLRALADEADIDMFLIIGGENPRFTRIISEAYSMVNKPLIVAMTDSPDMVPEEYRFLLDCGIPVYPDGRRAANALAKLAHYAEFRKNVD